MQTNVMASLAPATWLGVIDWSLLRIGALLCIAYGLIYVWCDLCRIEASLRDMLAESKLKQAEDKRKEQEANGEPFEPTCEYEQLLRHVIQLRRKAFLLRRNADKFDHLLFKPLRLLLSFFAKNHVKLGGNGRLSSNLEQRHIAGLYRTRFFPKFLDQFLGSKIHGTALTPNDKAEPREKGPQ